MTQRRIYAISKNNTEHDNGEKTNHLNYALKVIQKKTSVWLWLLEYHNREYTSIHLQTVNFATFGSHLLHNLPVNVLLISLDYVRSVRNLEIKTKHLFNSC